MELSSEVEKLLYPVNIGGSFSPDPYESLLRELLQPWQEVDTADVGIVGVPFDTAVVIRRGCKHGPYTIRESFDSFTNYEPGIDVEISEELTIADFGDIDCVETDVQETHRRIRKVLSEIFKKNITPLILGGDHGITFPNVGALCDNAEEDIGLVVFDAHLDVRKSHHGEISSGTPFRRVMEEIESNPIQPNNFVEIGINGWLNSSYYMDYMREKEVRVVTAREVHKKGIGAILEEVVPIVTQTVGGFFISIDIDSLDFSFAPGTCSPNPGGLHSDQLLEAVYVLGSHPSCKGMDLVEVAPPLDVRDLTSRMGASLALQFLGACEERKARA